MHAEEYAEKAVKPLELQITLLEVNGMPMPQTSSGKQFTKEDLKKHVVRKAVRVCMLQTNDEAEDPRDRFVGNTYTTCAQIHDSDYKCFDYWKFEHHVNPNRATSNKSTVPEFEDNRLYIRAE